MQGTVRRLTSHQYRRFHPYGSHVVRDAGHYWLMPPVTVPTFDSLAFWRLVFELVAPALVYVTIRTLRLRRFHVPIIRDTYIPYLLVAALWMILTRSVYSTERPYVEFALGIKAPLTDNLYVLTIYMLVPGIFAWVKTHLDVRNARTPYDDGWEAFFQEHANDGLYVRMTMKSGDAYAGFMGEGSRYSAISKTLYFSAACHLDDDDNILQQENTAGFIVSCVDIRHIQFINPIPENNNAKGKGKVQNRVRS